MMRALIIAVFTLCLSATTGWGFENDEAFDDPALEARAVDLAKELRCLVCQNQSIMESDADLAKDLRLIVREQVAAGKSDDEIKDFVTERYGDFVLLRPPFKPKTWVLWFGPPVIVGGALIGFVVFWRRRHGYAVAAPSAAPPLSEAERKRLDALLGDKPEA
jgi:cytochrome c-type biogenesis protein CcmH